MVERRQHPQECLRQEEWGEIKSFVAGTKDHRLGLKLSLENIRKENKERFEIMLAQLRMTDGERVLDHKDSEKRIRNLEHFRWMVAGALVIVSAVLIPVALAVIK